MNTNQFFSLDGPLEVMPTERQMRIANLGAFPFLARNQGADPHRLLERHDIDPFRLSDPDHYIDCQSYVNLLEDCSSSLNDPLFGLRLAQLQEPDVYGCVTALCRASSTVREAIHCLTKFIPVTHSPAAMQELIVNDETAILRWGVRTDLGNNKQANYQAALLNLKLLRQLGGRNFRPDYVNLAVDTRHKDIDELERQLGCRFNSRTTENLIAFPAQVLDQRITSANKLLFKLLGGYLGRVKEAARITLADRVQDYVRSSLSEGNCTIERCAAKMDVSVRTLQAKLSESQLSFSDILEEQRIALAENYLKQAQYSLDDVAANLGYSEQSSFGRAFKRWTGLTPKQYRQKISLN
ncbi:AraC family transcriptional regulator [Ketobacter sp. MCCC 1A13808]|uniref:AraC family transcriptional regulator n=1 Tax=Ketobacter sp. MCCC 1A13808 TaxID=2602738 RepID=UPI000F270814|nr:AraC family transcriptional regulator [Ketobacter sp. MCCC 1A13808]MVF13500.1 AraC family transcriptional regulator [Ketobacter sp. MCCC 1A13808]RLP52296.1 MAG: AraC family transcriptional regulator [Ketobacter sp.]